MDKVVIYTFVIVGFVVLFIIFVTAKEFYHKGRAKRKG